jgi:hypothetical protein
VHVFIVDIKLFVDDLLETQNIILLLKIGVFIFGCRK